MPSDDFSVRWTMTQPFAAGDWRFTTLTDDGVRLFVDGVAVIDNWTDHSPTTDTATVPLTAGSHTVRMEYYEAGSEATATLSVEQVVP